MLYFALQMLLLATAELQIRQDGKTVNKNQRNRKTRKK